MDTAHQNLKRNIEREIENMQNLIIFLKNVLKRPENVANDRIKDHLQTPEIKKEIQKDEVVKDLDPKINVTEASESELEKAKNEDEITNFLEKAVDRRVEQMGEKNRRCNLRLMEKTLSETKTQSTLKRSAPMTEQTEENNRPKKEKKHE